jgi:hypothetical protein
MACPILDALFFFIDIDGTVESCENSGSQI